MDRKSEKQRYINHLSNFTPFFHYTAIFRVLLLVEKKRHTLLSASNSFFCSSEAIYESVNVATTTTPISSALRNGAILSSAFSSQRIWRFSEALAQLCRMLMAERMRSFRFCSMESEKLINLFTYLF